MKGRRVAWLIAAAFAVAVGHYGWQTLFAARAPADFVVGGEVPALAGTDPEDRNLYLRRMFYLTQAPRHAWIEVEGRDRLNLFVNGQMVEHKAWDGFPVSVVADLAPFLKRGPNAIAIEAKQASYGYPPKVAIRGGYVLDDGEHPIEPDELWHCRNLFERQAAYWFAPEFDDRRWPLARLTTMYLRSKVARPPRAVEVQGSGRWITPPEVEGDCAAIRRRFDLAGRPRQAWLRLTTASPYRLAVNGHVLDQQEEQLATRVTLPAVERIYDLTPVLHRGTNAVALVLTGMGALPHVRADLDVETTSGQFTDLGSDERWLAHAGTPGNWLQVKGRDDQGWEVCDVDPGDMNVPPWQPRRDFVEIAVPFSVWLGQAAGQVLLVVTVFFLTLRACRWAARRLQALGEDDAPYGRVVYLALVPTTVILACAILASYDPRIARQEVYCWYWLLPAVSLVPLQWWLLARPRWLKSLRMAYWEPACQRMAERVDGALASMAGAWNVIPSFAGLGFVHMPARLPRVVALTIPPAFVGDRASGGPAAHPVPVPGANALHPEAKEGKPWYRTPAGALVIVFMLAGFWIRARDVATEPLQWDEVENYQATKAFLHYGYPCLEVHEDAPKLAIHTSELQFIPMALVALVYDRDCYVVRFPGVVMSALTVLVLFLFGRTLFGTPVGLIAAALFTFSSMCVAMSTFGRYFPQLQLWALLTIYFFWLTIRGSGPIDRRYLWLTGLSFIAMFLTWEAAALLAPGMILAALAQRRKRLGTVLLNGSVWLAMLVVLMVVILQYCHTVLAQTKFLWYGTSLSDVSLKAMWGFPLFRPWYYVWEASWNQDALLPMLALVGSILLAIRHPFQARLRFLLLIFLSNCLIMMFLLPATAWRYSSHLTPLLILLAAATVGALGRALIKLVRQVRAPAWCRSYAAGVAALIAVAFVVVSSGWALELGDLPGFRVEGYGPNQFKFPNLEGPTRYVFEHMEDGDVVLATDPFQINYFMNRLGRKGRVVDYWVETNLRHPATLDDHRALPLDRRDGTVRIPDLDSLEDVFARHQRVWYIAQPLRHWDQNITDATIFLRQNMDVVYEDWQALVLLRDRDHRPMGLKKKDEQALRTAQSGFLP